MRRSRRLLRAWSVAGRPAGAWSADPRSHRRTPDSAARPFPPPQRVASPRRHLVICSDSSMPVMASISDIRALLRSRAETRNFVGYPVGRIPSPSLAVHSWGRTTLHEAAYYGNRRIVRLLIDAEADVDVRDDDGRAFPLLRHRRMGRPNHAVCRAGARRCTGPRRMAISKRSRSCSCAAPPWSGTVGGNAALSRTADRRRTPMRAGARRSNGRSNE